MILKKGITGFFDSKDLCIPKIDFKIFKTLCHTIDNCTEWKLTKIDNTLQNNYYSAEFDTPIGIIYILINMYYPIVGFTENMTIGDIVFKDITDIDYFLNEYEIVSAEILNSAFSDSENELSEIELNEVTYWKPSSVGNVVFNCWD